MKMKLAACLLVFSAGVLQGAEQAGPPGKKPLTKGVEACREDVERWCKDVEPGEGRLGSCLRAHLKDLSKPCLKFARHGGKGHELESLQEIDRDYRPAGPSR